MPKLRGRRHRWDRKDEMAICTNCGLKVDLRFIRRGGLPICGEAIESKPQPISAPARVYAPRKKKSYFQEFFYSYHKGCERYGVWWKLFTFSMLGFSVVFVAVAITLVVLFLL
jgi:hypothetical protein